MSSQIHPSAETAVYRLVKSIPDSISGLRLMHMMIYGGGWSPPRGTQRVIEEIQGSCDSRIKVEIFRPSHASGPLPLLLHMHGGGFAIGAPRQDYDLFARLIATTPCVIVAPHYRRSLQAPFPAALDDCYDVLVWMKANACRLGGRAEQIMVMGQSAGGGLAAALCLLARDRGAVKIACQFLLWAMLDDQTESTRLDPKGLSWSVRKNRLAWQLYLGSKKSTPYAAPARAIDLTGLPPAVGRISNHDLFCPENTSYFERLKSSGVDVDFKVIRGGYHGVEVFAPRSVPGKCMLDEVTQIFAAAVSTRFSAQTP